MNSSDWRSNITTTSILLLPGVTLINDPALNNTLDTTEYNPVSNTPCVDILSTQNPAVTKLPGSLDALFYIIVVLLFYAFSIIVLMVKYIRRERDEAHLRNYYIEFVARDKFRSAQYKNRQVMKRTFCKESQNDNHTRPGVEDEIEIIQSLGDQRNQIQTISQRGDTFNRLPTSSDREEANKESSTFLGMKNHFCKSGFFARKFCNKQLCSKCVSESVPTIDWDDGKNDDIERGRKREQVEDVIELRSCHSEKRFDSNLCKKTNQKLMESNNRLIDRDNSIFVPIIECDSDVENEDVVKQPNISLQWNNEHDRVRAKYDITTKQAAVWSHYSLDINHLLAKMPPLDAASTFNDMDTLDGLSNLGSEAGSQSLLDYSASVKGTNSVCGGQCKNSPAFVNKSASGDERYKDLSDFLSERTSLLSCTLSIDDDGDDDIHTNLSSAKHHPNGISLQSSSNGKLKDVVISNGKSILSSLSKSLSSDEGDRKKFVNDISHLTEDSGVFKNLKYFLRGFAKDGKVKEAYETLNLLPRETCFGPGSPKSLFSNSKIKLVSTKCDHADGREPHEEMDTVDVSLLNIRKCENSGNRWGNTDDTEEDVGSEYDRSSSFGDYFMGEASMSQVIDLSKPLVRRQLDSATKDILSQVFVGLGEPQRQELNPPVIPSNNMLPGCLATRRETNV